VASESAEIQEKVALSADPKREDREELSGTSQKSLKEFLDGKHESLFSFEIYFLIIFLF
jgi:hypothetical protein